MANKPVYLLDSFALLAYLNGEPGESRVQKVLELAKSQDCRLVMSLINLSEVLYISRDYVGSGQERTFIKFMSNKYNDNELVILCSRVEHECLVEQFNEHLMAMERKE